LQLQEILKLYWSTTSPPSQFVCGRDYSFQSEMKERKKRRRGGRRLFRSIYTSHGERRNKRGSY